jgi:predicted nicotinamide N-methyase
VNQSLRDEEMAAADRGNASAAASGRNQLPVRVVSFSLSYNRTAFTFVMPADPDDVFDAIVEEQYAKDRFLPYWAERWPSSTPFFDYLMSRPPAPGILVCDLGCGLGVIAAALAGSGHTVIATDISADGCRFARCNISSNKGISRVVCADWRASPFNRRFDLIVASDILYEERWIAPILDFVATDLAAGGEMLIADPCRRYWELFKRTATLRGFLIELRQRSIIEHGKTTVEIVSIRRP